MTSLNELFKELELEKNNELNKKNECDANYCSKCNEFLTIKCGEYICTSCGYSYDYVISESAEWREFNDSKTKGIQRCNNSEYNWNGHWMSSPERSLSIVYRKLKIYGVNGGLTKSIIDLANKIYIELYTNQTNTKKYSPSRGDFRDGLIAICLLYACYENNVSRSILEISKICNINESDITRAKKLFVEIMKDTKLINLNTVLLSYKDYIERYCNILDIGEEYIDYLYKLTELVDKNSLINNNTPQSMVCGCIFYISIMYNLKISKQKISQYCDISIPTINKVYNILLENTQVLLI